MFVTLLKPLYMCYKTDKTNHNIFPVNRSRLFESFVFSNPLPSFRCWWFWEFICRLQINKYFWGFFPVGFIYKWIPLTDFNHMPTSYLKTIGYKVSFLSNCNVSLRYQILSHKGMHLVKINKTDMPIIWASSDCL